MHVLHAWFLFTKFLKLTFIFRQDVLAAYKRVYVLLVILSIIYKSKYVFLNANQHNIMYLYYNL